jgi:hypothetical protein
MMGKLAVLQGIYYEGNSHDLRVIHPSPVISPLSCSFISPAGDDQVIFREDSFDPVTRIRRGRLYVGGRREGGWSSARVDDGMYRPLNIYTQATHGVNWIPDAIYDAWQATDIGSCGINGQVVQIGAYSFVTPWRIVSSEFIATGHVLLTLRANSLLGVIPELANEIANKDGNTVDSKPVQTALDSLVNAFHRQQAASTVDVARETAKVILTAWIGLTAQGDDLGNAIKKIPDNKRLIQWAASIVNRLHPRGKSAEQEKRRANGIMLRSVVDEDAEASVHLIGMLLREIGWARP